MLGTDPLGTIPFGTATSGFVGHEPIVHITGSTDVAQAVQAVSATATATASGVEGALGWAIGAGGYVLGEIVEHGPKWIDSIANLLRDCPGAGGGR